MNFATWVSLWVLRLFSIFVLVIIWIFLLNKKYRVAVFVLMWTFLVLALPLCVLYIWTLTTQYDQTDLVKKGKWLALPVFFIWLHILLEMFVIKNFNRIQNYKIVGKVYVGIITLFALIVAALPFFTDATVTGGAAPIIYDARKNMNDLAIVLRPSKSGPRSRWPKWRTYVSLESQVQDIAADYRRYLDNYLQHIIKEPNEFKHYSGREIHHMFYNSPDTATRSKPDIPNRQAPKYAWFGPRARMKVSYEDPQEIVSAWGGDIGLAEIENLGNAWGAVLDNYALDFDISTDQMQIVLELDEEE